MNSHPLWYTTPLLCVLAASSDLNLQDVSQVGSSPCLVQTSDPQLSLKTIKSCALENFSSFPFKFMCFRDQYRNGKDTNDLIHDMKRCRPKCSEHGKVERQAWSPGCRIVPWLDMRPVRSIAGTRPHPRCCARSSPAWVSRGHWFNVSLVARGSATASGVELWTGTDAGTLTQSHHRAA
eukprot:746617-Hanusia_phi.AAC.6